MVYRNSRADLLRQREIVHLRMSGVTSIVREHSRMSGVTDIVKEKMRSVSRSLSGEFFHVLGENSLIR